IRLLSDLKIVFGNADAMSTASILKALQELEESPWADLKGKPLNDRGLAHRLRQYGISPKNVAIGTHRPKGYTRADLHDVWERYTPATAARSATSATSATNPQNQSLRVAEVADEGLADEVADDLADPLPLSDWESGKVAQVALVAEQPG